MARSNIEMTADQRSMRGRLGYESRKTVMKKRAAIGRFAEFEDAMEAEDGIVKPLPTAAEILREG